MLLVDSRLFTAATTRVFPSSSRFYSLPRLSSKATNWRLVVVVVVGGLCKSASSLAWQFRSLLKKKDTNWYLNFLLLVELPLTIIIKMIKKYIYDIFKK